LNVQGKTDTEGRHIAANEVKNGQIHQQWDVIYVDTWKGEPTKGELNEEFGLYVERPFNVISAMGSGRYLEVINNGMSSTLTHGRENQPRDNSTKSMDFTLRDHSMLSQP
jgi:hypothetical protein